MCRRIRATIRFTRVSLQHTQDAPLVIEEAMSEMARAERALARKSENRALRDMIKNLSRSGFGDSKSLFCNAAPSQSLFAAPRYASTPLGGKRKLGAIQTPESYYRRYKGTPNGSTSRKKRPRRDPEQEWNQRCARIFQKVVFSL